MTLPNGPDGVNTAQGIYLVSSGGYGDQTIATLTGNDTDTVRSVYKAHYLNTPSSVWGNSSGPLAGVFSALAAIPGVGLAESIIGSVVDGIVALIGSIPIIGPPIQNLANFLGISHTTANTAHAGAINAQYSADTANAGVALLNAKAAGTGTVFTDTFNRAANTTTLGSNYDRTMGSGPGTWGTDGMGNVIWTTTGGPSSDQACLDRVTAAMTTKYQSIAVVLTAPPGAGQSGDNSRMRLALRCNAAKDTYVCATVDAGFVEIGYVNAGTYTRLGATTAVTQNNGDLWEFQAGTAADDYDFLLLQNNLTVCYRNDTSNLSLAGAAPSTWVGTYDYGAMIANAGAIVFFFVQFQIAAPTVQVLTVADRTP